VPPTPSPAAPGTPLPALLGRILVAFARDAATEARPAFVLRRWANLLRPLDGAALTVRDLRARTCVSRRTLNPWLTDLERRGWATTTGAGRSKVVRLTEAGTAVAAEWREVPGTVEAAWRAASGVGPIDRLRAALAELVAQLPLELPHYPASYGTVDATIAGGAGVAGRGVDWRPVPRAEPGDVGAAARLPLHALISHAVVAFALDYESEEHGPFADRGPFATAATLLRAVGDDVTPVATTPFATGLSVQARYTLRRFGLGDVERGPGSDGPVVRLTAKGREWRDAYVPTVDAVTRAWCAAYGDTTVAEVAGAAEAVGALLPPGLPDYPLDA
jgi:DNA-binding MarR family transcriptional regulator